MNISFSNNQSELDFSILVEYESVVEQVAAVKALRRSQTSESASPPSAVIPFLIRRSALFMQCPSLSDMLSVAKGDCKKAGENTDLIAILAPYDDLAALLPARRHFVSTVMILVLPDRFESFLLNAVSQRPGLCNHLTTDLQYSCFYYEWELDPGHKVLLLDSILSKHLYYNCQYTHVASDSSNHEFAPFVFVAGNSAAIGGFTVDNDLMDDAQATSCSASSYVPSLQFEDSVLVDAALESKRIGLAPWASDWHQVKTGCKVRMPWIQDFTLRQFENASKLRGPIPGPESQDI